MSIAEPFGLLLTLAVVAYIGLSAWLVQSTLDAGRGWVALIIGSVLFLILALVIRPAFAHDHNRPELNEWMMGLHAKNSTWCCDGNDTDAIEDWETRDDHYRVKFRGEWFEVPDSAIVEGPNKSGAPLLWMNKGYMGMSVRCRLISSIAVIVPRQRLWLEQLIGFRQPQILPRQHYGVAIRVAGDHLRQRIHLEVQPHFSGLFRLLLLSQNSLQC